MWRSGAANDNRLQRIDAILVDWGERGFGANLREMSSTLGRLVMRTQCPICLGRGWVRTFTRKGILGKHECSSCNGQGHTTITDHRVHPHLIPGTNPYPLPDHLIDLDRAINELPVEQYRVVHEHYRRAAWYTAEQHARAAGLSVRTYWRRLRTAQHTLADRLWPKPGG